jgi:PIN domain nuclease of toxin-antitoxin system
VRYLLDTHTFLWKIAEPRKIPAKVFRETEDPDNEVFLSAVSLWEISIKTRRKRLDLGGVSNKDLISLAEKMGIRPIELSPAEAATYGNLKEDTHFDPFDRMLIWQAISRKLTLVSGDKEFMRFAKDGLKLLWN